MTNAAAVREARPVASAAIQRLNFMSKKFFCLFSLGISGRIIFINSVWCQAWAPVCSDQSGAWCKENIACFDRGDHGNKPQWFVRPGGRSPRPPPFFFLLLLPPPRLADAALAG